MIYRFMSHIVVANAHVLVIWLVRYSEADHKEYVPIASHLTTANDLPLYVTYSCSQCPCFGDLVGEI